MSDASHLLIPFAACSATACHAALPTLTLPHVEKLLLRLQATAPDTGDEYTLSPPHERALARACHWPPLADGCLPWAAWHSLRHIPTHADHANEACAFITPCHWNVAADHISLTDPRALQLDEDASRKLMAIFQPYFEEDGIALQWLEPNRWLARGEIFRGLATASLDRVVGRDVNIWMPDTPQARPLRRLQSEMQMLLYTHAFTDARLAQGLLPVNSFWISGSGALPPGSTVSSPGYSAMPPSAASAALLPASAAQPASASQPAVVVVRTLADAALREDWPAWADAWRALDAQHAAHLLQQAENGKPVTLTLCGERSAQSWHTAPRSAWQGLRHKIRHVFSPTPAYNLLEKL